ncbi:hypothetical protein [Bacillus sp. Marseille-P3661]|uniref:hypothetical protein n=1 Tax=Bacillus sp. Marseille-P3661 TaxID=1936234 RepID=UPI000C86595F|nr:hypothetical protein [Bacillus sp. Marseille-P3661]
MVLKAQKSPINHKTTCNAFEKISISYCPNCGHKINEDKSFIDRFFQSDRDIEFFWCNECFWRGEITKIIQFTATEVDEG